MKDYMKHLKYDIKGCLVMSVAGIVFVLACYILRSIF